MSEAQICKGFVTRGAKKFKIFLARRGGASRPARPARFARLSFGICQVKVVHFFGTSPLGPVG